MSKPLVLVVNFGCPEKPDPPEVETFLRDLFSDPLMIQAPGAVRWFLKNWTARRRAACLAAVYRQIWTDEGAPLRVHSVAFRDKLARALHPNFEVALAMRYGQPSIESVLQSAGLSSRRPLVVFPLFPQSAQATTGSIVKAVGDAASSAALRDLIRIVPPFFDHPGFLDAFTANGRPLLDEFEPDHVLMSFHGLPLRDIRRLEPSPGHCLRPGYSCCRPLTAANRGCYVAQCLETARRLGQKLGISENRWTACFQSRSGPGQWTAPHTENLIAALPKQGCRRLLVFCPSFVTDCIETLEEIAIRGRRLFRESGGQDLRLVPSLNDSDSWVAAASTIVREEGGRHEKPNCREGGLKP